MVDMGFKSSATRVKALNLGIEQLKEKELLVARKEAILSNKYDDINKKQEKLDNLIKEEGQQLKEIAKNAAITILPYKEQEIETVTALPDPAQNIRKFYYVKTTTGRITRRKKAGYYYSDGKKWKKI